MQEKILYRTFTKAALLTSLCLSLFVLSSTLASAATLVHHMGTTLDVSTHAQAPLHPNSCSAYISPDSAAGASPGYSMSLYASWSENCSTSAKIQIGWGDGTGWYYYQVNPSGSGNYYHTWSSSGFYTVGWKLFAYEFGAGYVQVASGTTYVTVS